LDRELTGRHLGKAWPFEHDLVIDYAVDGRDALDHMRTTRFAMIVLDWKLPGMGGGEVLRHIRRNGVHIPVIVISGLQREAIDEDLESLGAAFLNKDDMDPHTFYEAIAASLKLMGLTQPSPA
jgi:CheY-like chemotaxis protein